jgi:hypothetical protein
VKLTYWRTVQYLPDASEDPVELYCSLLL